MQERKPEFGPLEHRPKMGFTGSVKDKTLNSPCTRDTETGGFLGLTC